MEHGELINVPAIVITIVGVLLIVTILGLLYWCHFAFCKRQRRRAHQNIQSTTNITTQQQQQQQQQQLLEQQQQQTPELSVSSPPPHPNALQQLPHPNAPHRRIKAWSCNHQYNDPPQYSILNKTNQSNDESMEIFGKSKTRNALNSTLVIDERLLIIDINRSGLPARMFLP